MYANVNFLCVKHDYLISIIVSNIIIVSAHKMTHTKDNTHLGNSQWRVDIRVEAFWRVHEVR